MIVVVSGAGGGSGRPFVVLLLEAAATNWIRGQPENMERPR